LSSDGKFYTCLFVDHGHDLQPWLDDPSALEDRLREIWNERADRYSEIRGAVSSNKHIEMYVIGG
jgi:cyclic pyranopterin phosphate synthase